MPSIHPSATIDLRSELADDVAVGPGCIIEGKVQIGSSSQLIANVYLRGPLLVGTSNTFYPFVCVGFAPQHHHFDPSHDGEGVVIGCDNRLREGVAIHRSMARGPRPSATAIC